MTVLSEKAQAVMNYLQSNMGSDVTADDIAAATNIEKKAITGVINGLACQKKGYDEGFVYREKAGKTEDGKTIKYIRLTSTGAGLDPSAELATAE